MTNRKKKRDPTLDVGNEAFDLSSLDALKQEVLDKHLDVLKGGVYRPTQQRKLPMPARMWMHQHWGENDALPQIVGSFPLKLYTPPETAAILGLSSPFILAMWRRSGKPHLPYIKMGKEVRYAEEDIIDFLNSHRILPVDRPRKKR